MVAGAVTPRALAATVAIAQAFSVSSARCCCAINAVSTSTRRAMVSKRVFFFFVFLRFRRPVLLFLAVPLLTESLLLVLLWTRRVFRGCRTAALASKLSRAAVVVVRFCGRGLDCRGSVGAGGDG